MWSQRSAGSMGVPSPGTGSMGSAVVLKVGLCRSEPVLAKAQTAVTHH